MERREPESVYELLQHEEYTPEEVSRLLGIDLDVVRHAVYTGNLPARMAGEDIVGIRREDVVRWYNDQAPGGPSQR
jgi:excisionase family DNA binding protein